MVNQTNGQIMMSHQKVIDNLKSKVSNMRQTYENSYTQYINKLMYNKAIQQIVDEKLGSEQNYLDINGIVSVNGY